MNPERGLRAAYHKPSVLTIVAANRRAHGILQVGTRAVLEREVNVPDVSFWQDKNTTPQGIDFPRMKAAGAQGVIIRAGQGAWEDEDFKTNWGNAKAAGLPRGSYWYYDPRVSAKEQADRWAALLAPDLPELDIWTDAEYPDAWGGAWAGWTHLYDFQERLKFKLPAAVQKSIYTGYYWWFDHVWSKTTTAQLAYFAQYPLCIAWYTSDPAVVKIPKPWETARWWQYTDHGDGLMYGAESLNIDLNYFNGNLQAYRNTFGLGTPPQPSDTITSPFIGVKRITGTRYGRKIYLEIQDPAEVAFKTVHANTADLLDYPSGICKRYGASMAWNTGEWDKRVEPYKPKDLFVNDGAVYVERKTFTPSLIFFKDNRPYIAHTNQAGQWNVSSGLRYLVQDGVMNDYLNGTTVEYTDRTARSINGIDKNGNVMRLTVDGENLGNGVRYGVTLKEAALIMLEFGAWVAYDDSAGGDTVDVLRGEVQNVPEDRFNGQPVERRVPGVLLAFAKEHSMANGTAQEILGNVSTIRETPSRYGTDTGGRVQAGKVIEFVRVVPVQVSGPADDPNDQWFELPDGNFVNYILAARKYYQILTEPTIPPPPSANKPASMDINLAPGSTVVIRDAAGVILWEGTA